MMTRTRQSVFILILAALVMIPTAACTRTKVVHDGKPVTKTSIVYRDVTTTTSVSVPVVDDAPKYSDYSTSWQLDSGFYPFTVELPIYYNYSYYDDSWFRTPMSASSTNTAGMRYHSYLNAALKGDKLIYCASSSKNCSLSGSFEVEVLPDNEVNRQYIEDQSFDQCQESTATGVKGHECWWTNETRQYTYHDITYTYKGFIYTISYSGSTELLDDAQYFANSFGFTDV